MIKNHVKLYFIELNEIEMNRIDPHFYKIITKERYERIVNLKYNNDKKMLLFSELFLRYIIETYC